MRTPVIVASILIAAFGFSSVPAGAQDTGFDYSQTTATVTIDTLSTVTPNILRTVTVTCPTAGYLVATASALFKFSVGSTFPGTIAYSLSIDSTSFQSSHQHNVFGNYVGGFHVFPATMQRVSACVAGQSVTHRFLATNGSNAGSTTAKQPRLVVVFYRERL